MSGIGLVLGLTLGLVLVLALAVMPNAATKAYDCYEVVSSMQEGAVSGWLLAWGTVIFCWQALLSPLIKGASTGWRAPAS